MAAQNKIDTLQTVELAEGVEILLRPAGPMARGLATLIDSFIILLVLILLGTVMSLIGILIGEHESEGLMLIGIFIVYWGYFVYFEARTGRTPGKRTMGLRVVRTSGAALSWGNSLLRNLLRLVDMMPSLPVLPLFGYYLFGLVSCLATRRFQRLGDLVADTVVVYQQVQMRDTPVRLRFPVVAAPPPLVLTREEQLALIQFRDRAGLWSDSRKEELANQLEPVLGVRGREAVVRALSMGTWLRES